MLLGWSNLDVCRRCWEQKSGWNLCDVQFVKDRIYCGIFVAHLCFFSWSLQQGYPGRCVSLGSVPRRRIQSVTIQFVRNAGVCLPRSGYVKVSGLHKHLRASNKLANNFLNGTSGSLTGSVTGGSRRRSPSSVIYAGTFSSEGTSRFFFVLIH